MGDLVRKQGKLVCACCGRDKWLCYWQPTSVPGQLRGDLLLEPGWEEWTDAALFWKRPNIHAWFELMGYEKAAEEAARELDASLSEVDWSALSLDVPVYRP